MITCAKCPTQVLPDWHFCPACGELLAEKTSDATTGIKFISAPTQDQVIQSEGFAKTDAFTVAFLQYMLSITQSPNNIVFARFKLLSVFRQLAGSPVDVDLLWLTLSFVADRYFQDKAYVYRWTLASEEDIRLRWFELMKQVFLNNRHAPLSVSVVKAWVEDFLALHKYESGPLLTCSSCQSRCHYQVEVKDLIQRDDSILQDLTICSSIPNTSSSESLAWCASQITHQWAGSLNTDLSYCLLSHVSDLWNLSSDAKLVLYNKMRSSLEDIAKEEQTYDALLPSQVGQGITNDTEKSPPLLEQLSLLKLKVLASILWPLAPKQNVVRDEVIEMVRREISICDGWRDVFSASIKKFAITDEELLQTATSPGGWPDDS